MSEGKNPGTLIADQYIKEFAYFKDRIYFDCSTMGMPPKRSIRVGESFLRNFAERLGEHDSSEDPRQKGRELIARMIGADPDEIYFTKNTTEGNNVLPKGYPFKAGDEIILGNADFAAVWLPYTRLQQKGIKLVWVNNENGCFPAEEYIAKITDKTRAIAISHAQSSSGYVTDLEKLGTVCREKGILLAVDGIQATGRLPIDVHQMKVDLYASGSFKGMMGVMGEGFCYIRKELMEQVEPAVLSGNIDYEGLDFRPGFTEFPVPNYAHGPRRMASGTDNTYGLAVMSESVKMLLEIGQDKIAERIRELEVYYRNQLKEKQIPVKMLGSDDPSTWGGSVSFVLDPEKREPLKQALAAANIHAAARSYFRVSFHFYNTEEEIDRLISVLEAVYA